MRKCPCSTNLIPHSSCFFYISLSFTKPSRRRILCSQRSFVMCQPKAPQKVLADLTKYSVSFAVAASLIYLHDAPTLLFVTGAATNSAAGKLLKHVINQPRPESADGKSSPGMPSSHAVSLSYLSIAFVAYLIKFTQVARWVVLVESAVVLFVAALASSWRVTAGYHTLSKSLSAGPLDQ